MSKAKVLRTRYFAMHRVAETRAHQKVQRFRVDRLERYAVAGGARVQVRVRDSENIFSTSLAIFLDVAAGQ